MNEKRAWQAAQDAFLIEADAVEKALHAIPEAEFMRAVDVLAKAERIGAAGCGHSGIVCQHFAHLMCCIERPARFISPPRRCTARPAFSKRAT